MKRNENVIIRLLAVTIAVIFLSGCAAKKQFWGDEKTGFILNYRLDEGQELQYQMSGSQNQDMEVMGQPMGSETNFSTNYTLTGTGKDDQLNLLSDVTINDMEFKINSAMAGEIIPDVSNVNGKRFALTFSPHGKELDFAGAENIKINVAGQGEQSIQNYFREILVNLPKKPVKIGDTWTTKEEDTIPQSNMEIKTVLNATNRLIGYETVYGYECLKIETKSKGTMEGSGVQMGNEFDMEGDMEGESTWYFAYKKGVFVKSISDMFLEATIAVTSPQNMTIPMTQETKSEVKMLTAAGK